MYCLYYQPKINCKTKKITSCEALIRLKKEGQIISPKNFLPKAEKDGSIVDIDRWVMGKIVEDARRIFTKTFEEKITISFNVSALTFSQKDFYENIKMMITKCRDFECLFEIEITETALINEKSKAIYTINQLKKEGIKFALDDFGTGYSSLASFREFPIDTIKIDKCFTDNIIEDYKTEKIVDALIYLAKNLNIKTVAEGVENLEQVEMLTNMECTELQGYYYSKPLPIEKFIIYVRSINQPSKNSKFIQWSKEYSTNLNALDSQHFIWVNLLNKLFSSLKNEKIRKQDNVQNYISLVEDFTHQHFLMEEKIMKKFDYPEIEQHLNEHNIFLKNFKKFQKNLTHIKERDIYDLFMIIKDWFLKHEVQNDRKLGNFIKKKLKHINLR